MKLKTNRLELVPLEEKYAKELLEIWQDPETIRYTNALLLEDVESAREKIEGWLKREILATYTTHFVILREKEVLGVIGIPTINEKDGKYGFYYQLIKRFWHNGYGKEAAKAILIYAIKDVKAKMLLADVVPANEASVSILRGLGFKQIGITRDGFTENGNVHHVMHFQYL